MLRQLITACLDLLVPPRRTERRVHDLTLDDIHRMAHEDGLPYRDPMVRDLVWEIKYYGNGHAAKLAGEYLADELLAIAAEELGTPILIPMPMHPARRKSRGHNQTEALCEAALRALGQGESARQKVLGPSLRGYPQTILPNTFASPFEYRKDVLERVVDTPHQQGLHRSKRLKNVEQSMIAHPELVEGRVCVVVDDVTTTGATLSEAKRALLAAGARRVHCVALARS